ncbi:MAG: GTP 3',8-cyclase MoaA, partial [Akkermansiaceae bacterium]
RLAAVFCSLGVTKLRLTGGEPLLRRGLVDLVRMLAEIPGKHDLAMTTNGSALARYAKKLKTAGLERVTISMDALDPETFVRMNGSGASPGRVIEGIDAALEHGLKVKINSVIQRGVNEDQIVALATFGRRRGITMRFIEYMDTGNTNGWKLSDVVPYTEMLQAIRQHYPLEAIPPNYTGETAKRFGYQDLAAQEVGFISSVSKPFCGDCNRARLSSDGQIFTCLFASHGHDLKTLLRGGASDDEIAEVIRSVWAARDDRYSELRSAIGGAKAKPEMSYIGG